MTDPVTAVASQRMSNVDAAWLGMATARGEAVPEDGYGGQYIADIADAVTAQRPDAPGLPDAEAQEVYRDVGVQMMFDEIKRDLHDFGVDFDVYFHEDDLHASGAVERAVARLTEMGNTYEKDGALWLRTEQYGDDKDRVVIKSDGQPAYISGDLAYYLDKKERGFGRCFIMLGADHHGYVGRMMAMCAAFGDTPHEDLEILIGQMVNLLARRPAAADVEAGRDGHHHERPGRGDRRRRRAVRAGPLHHRHQHRHRPGAVGQGVERQPRVLRAVRARSASLPSCGMLRTLVS